MTHAEARRIIEDAWRRVHGRDPTGLEASYTQAIAWLENKYGRAGQFAAFAANGQFNWGSLHARGSPPDCPPGSVEGFDVRPVCFLAFPDDVSAAAAFVRTLTKSGGTTAERTAATLDAMGGTPEDVATAMRIRPAYFEGPPGTEDEKVTAYAGAIRRALSDVSSGAPVPAIPSASTARRSSVLPWLLLLGAVGAAGYVYYRGVPPALARLARRL